MQSADVNIIKITRYAAPDNIKKLIASLLKNENIQEGNKYTINDTEIEYVQEIFSELTIEEMPVNMKLFKIKGKYYIAIDSSIIDPEEFLFVYSLNL